MLVWKKQSGSVEGRAEGVPELLSSVLPQLLRPAEPSRFRRAIACWWPLQQARQGREAVPGG